MNRSLITFFISTFKLNSNKEAIIQTETLSKLMLGEPADLANDI